MGFPLCGDLGFISSWANSSGGKSRKKGSPGLRMDQLRFNSKSWPSPVSRFEKQSNLKVIVIKNSNIVYCLTIEIWAHQTFSLNYRPFSVEIDLVHSRVFNGPIASSSRPNKQRKYFHRKSAKKWLPRWWSAAKEFFREFDLRSHAPENRGRRSHWSEFRTSSAFPFSAGPYFSESKQCLKLCNISEYFSLRSRWAIPSASHTSFYTSTFLYLGISPPQIWMLFSSKFSFNISSTEPIILTKFSEDETSKISRIWLGHQTAASDSRILVPKETWKSLLSDSFSDRGCPKNRLEADGSLWKMDETRFGSPMMLLL